ncbi:hypothetical protein E4M02_00050 [Brevundimonas sp. S30B]|uniref:hypothetical protein n=1 Tax=unclassified Brevundimonas TaxID=2622653 RepID=UPI001072EB0E|nr:MULTISPECIES: hypothetical protein [unclassified Brevundimonas]QBX37678.1 hypothetical protein E4M01_07770 [Brevundimonas sp. MF30-B]TFW03527.1 hypothetical protein E4M02_00050 [Brevundimonas sp. S30B]
MNRVEPNLLLALATAFPFTLVLMTASIYGPEGLWLRYVVISAVVILAFLPLNAVLSKRMGLQRPPMIHLGSPSTLVWAGLFPLMTMIMSLVPLFFPDRDLGLLIIIAAIWFALTIESAIKARRR